MKANVVLGVTGSIAAYKAAELVRLMKKRGWDVTVVMTAAATKFVGEVTFRTLSQNPVYVTMFPDTYVPELPHIALAQRAQVFVIAPCTANVMAKLAHGVADDLLTCTALATKAPLVIAPAMNENMWDHPATQANLATLKARGAHVLDVGVGDLACGWEGRGRMVEPDQVAAAVDALLGRK